MCGIFGYLNFKPVELDEARVALNTLKHRGPDQWNEFSDSRVYMGHRRLSILDLSEQGKQPMLSEDQSVIITVNGEIYNFKKLRTQLGEHLFRSQSDSEVILHGYRQWGIEKLIERIEGMYAIVIYDTIAGKVFLIRDRVGIKPLYFSYIEDKWMWASELKAIASFYKSKLEIDNTALYDFLTYQYIPAPKTLYKQCFKLQAAHYAEIDLKTNLSSIKRYWSLNVNFKIKDQYQATQMLREKIRTAVTDQMVADVPVGFFLSGGVDSSTVVAASAEQKKQLKTFCIGFTDKNQDETHFAKQVANIFGTQHYEKILDGKTIQNLFVRLKEWYDEPFADLSCFPTFLVSDYAKQNVTVVLTGDGGDELFGGYKWYQRFKLIRSFRLYNLKFFKPILFFLSKISGLPVLRKYIPLFFMEELPLFTKLKGGLIAEEKIKFKELWNIPGDYDDYWHYRMHYRKELPIFTRLQVVDFNTYLPEDILTKVDRTSMAVALECRVPLLATEIVEFAFSLSEEVRFQKYGMKGVLKSSFDDMLPHSILDRKKQGFGIPAQVWKNDVLGKSRNRFEKILTELFHISLDR